MRIRAFLLSLTVPLLACPAQDYEGDVAGECGNGIDDDRDGLLDCDDPDCAGAPECQGDDDDAVDDDDSGPDDDDSGPDDDDSGPDDDDSGPDDDDSALPELADSTGTRIEITAPNFGMSLAVDVSLITIEGIAHQDVVSVTWATDGGASGTADGVTAWAAMDVPLQPGDNLFTATATDAEGDTSSASMEVVYNPGVPFGSGLELTPTVLFIGESTEVTASVYLNDESDLVDLEVGPADASGALTQTWASLAHPVDGPAGFYTATFTVEEPAETSWEVRAVATYADAAGATPPTTVQVVEALTEADFEAAGLIADAAWAAFEAAGGTTGGVLSRDAALAVLLAEPDVAEVGTSDDGGLGVWWITDSGIPYVLLNNPPGTRGGEPDGGPGMELPASGTGSMRGWTYSSAGRAGRGGVGPRDPSSVVSAMSLYIFQAYDDEFGDTVPQALEDAAEGSACPTFHPASITWKWNTAADLAAYAASTHYGLQHIETHGDTYFAGSATKEATWHYNGDGGVVAIYTRDEVSTAEELANQSAIANGRVAISAAWPGHWVVLPKFVSWHLRTDKAPDSLVDLAACRTVKNNTMRQAYLSNGARAVVGYTEYVHNDYAQARDWLWWGSIFGLETSGAAWEAMDAPVFPDEIVDADLQVEGALPSFGGHMDTRITNGDIRNPGFELGDDAGGVPIAWYEASAGNQSDWTVSASSGTYSGLGPAEGSLMAWAWTDMDGDPSTSYAELQHEACFNPETDYTISFQWAAVTSGLWGCSNSSVPYLIFLRFYDGTEVTNLWTGNWQSHICPNLIGSGYWQTTDWQTVSVPFSTTVDPSSVASQLRISLFGPEWEPFYLLVDNVQVYATP